MTFSPALRLGALFATVTMAATLTACGYTPLYAPGSGAAGAAAQVQVGSVSVAQETKNVGQRRSAQTVAQELKLDFPNSGADMDILTVTMQEDTTTLATQRTAAIQRAEIYLTADIVLEDPNGTRLLKTSLSTSAPYNVENTPFSTESGKTYARLTAARNLAAEISRRVYLFYSTHPHTGGRASAPAK